MTYKKFRETSNLYDIADKVVLYSENEDRIVLDKGDGYYDNVEVIDHGTMIEDGVATLELWLDI